VRWGNGTRVPRDPRGGRARPCGFTLVELLVVIVLVGVLMAIVVPSSINLARQNRRNTCVANLKAIGQALAIFHTDYGCYPPDSTEYLWTPEAVKEYRRLYRTDPPNDARTGTLTGAASYPLNDPNLPGAPFKPQSGFQYYKDESHALHGLGLYTLYYLGAYAAVVPPRSCDPRFPRVGDADYPTDPADPLRAVVPGKGYRQFGWFRGSVYLTGLKAFHCPENPTALDRTALLDHTRLPGITREGSVVVGGVAQSRTEYWNNYDQFYRRYFWNPGYLPPSVEDANLTEEGKWTLMLQQGATRNLLRAFPPADTVVTWCPYHHRGYIPRWPGDGGSQPTDKIQPGDQDLVLFLDGSVRRVVSRQDARMFEAATDQTSWPNAPVM